MREISISEFRARCHSLIREVNKTKQPLRITRDGQALAEIVPPSPVRKGRNFVGSGMDTFDILDNDIVSPIMSLPEIES